MTRAATLVPLSMLGQKGLVPVPLEFSGILSLSIRQNKLAVPMPFVLGPCSYVRFSRRRGKVTLSTSLPPAKVTLIASTIHPLLRTPSFNLSINEVALERAPPFDFEYPLPAFRSCLPPSAEPGIRPNERGSRTSCEENAASTTVSRCTVHVHDGTKASAVKLI